MNLPSQVFQRIEDAGGNGEALDVRAGSPSASSTDADLLDAYSRAVIAVVRKVGPAVISMLGPRGEDRGGSGPRSRRLAGREARRVAG